MISLLWLLVWSLSTRSPRTTCSGDSQVAARLRRYARYAPRQATSIKSEGTKRTNSATSFAARTTRGWRILKLEVLDAWKFVVPKRVAAEYDARLRIA